MFLLCRNRVRDFEHWKKVFDDNLGAAREAGLTLLHRWRDVDEPRDVYFLFEVASRERALAFVEDPESASTGEIAGVIEGELHFVEAVPER